MKNWYNQIEKPLRDLVKLLRDNGFNTTCSCGHLPRPYIQIEWLEGAEIDRIYKLLTDNCYKSFEIHAHWYYQPYNRNQWLEIVFEPERRVLAELSDIKNQPP